MMSLCPVRSGLTRVDRLSGKGVWSNKTAVRFLSTNFKYVYANDVFGNLLILDYNRGTELARWDARSWLLPMPNDYTDRLFLANHDGQIVCLHHRDQVKPLVVRTGKELIRIDLKKLPKDKKKKKDPDDEEVRFHAEPPTLGWRPAWVSDRPLLAFRAHPGKPLDR